MTTTRPIVLADDEPQIRSLIKRLLSKQGFAVLEAEDGLDALAVIRELNGEVAMLVSDVRMPKLDGASLCRKVKQAFPWVPVVLMSGHADSGERNAGDAFFQKPLQFDLLSQRVLDLCHRTAQTATEVR